jgi:hypothetical protein
MPTVTVYKGRARVEGLDLDMEARDVPAFAASLLHYAQAYIRSDDEKSPEWVLAELVETLAFVLSDVGTLCHRIEAADAEDLVRGTEQLVRHARDLRHLVEAGIA